jgi:hypothetical protein
MGSAARTFCAAINHVHITANITPVINRFLSMPPSFFECLNVEAFRDSKDFVTFLRVRRH